MAFAVEQVVWATSQNLNDHAWCNVHASPLDQAGVGPRTASVYIYDGVKKSENGGTIFVAKSLVLKKYWLKIINSDKGYIFWKDSPLEVNEFGMTMLLVVFCCSLYPQQVQTKMKQFDKKSFRKQVKINQNWLEELPKSRLGGSWGPSWPQDSFGQQKWRFWAAPDPPRRNPFRSLVGSCCHPEAPWGWKLRILGGSGCRVFFWRDFASFLEGSWAVKTLILHGRGSKNHNFTEVRILLLFGSILGVILELKSL